MMNILIPTDFSENAWTAIRYITAFYEKTPCNFYLLHVNRLLVASPDLPYLPDANTIEETLIKPSKLKLNKTVERINALNLKKEHHNIFTLTEYDFLTEAINKHVREKKIDLVVMGTKGASGLQEVLVGSNASNVIKKVPCTTLIIPENATYNPLEEIAFPTDFSMFYNISSLLPLTNLLKKTEAALRILHISKKETDLDNNQKNNKNLLEDFFSDNDFSFHFLTNTNVEQAVQCFVESRNIDMVVMVAKNQNYFQQILFHSKVEKISYHTDVPFLVLHE